MEREDAVAIWQRLPLVARDGVIAVFAVGGLLVLLPSGEWPRGGSGTFAYVAVFLAIVAALTYRRRYPLASGVAVAAVALVGGAIAHGLALLYLFVVILVGVSTAYYHRRTWALPLLLGLAGFWIIGFVSVLGHGENRLALFFVVPTIATLPILLGYSLRVWDESGHVFGAWEEALRQWRRIPVELRDGVVVTVFFLLPALVIDPEVALPVRNPTAGIVLAISLAVYVVPFAYRRRYPLGAGLGVAGVTLLSTLVGSPAAWTGLWITTFAGASAAYYHRERWSLAFMLPAAMVWILVIVGLHGELNGLASLVLLPATATVPILIGYALRLNAERGEQQARLQHARVLQERSEERARIARDVHDIVGHHLSAIRLQALGGRNAMRGDDPAEAEDVLGTVAEISGRALGEIRALLRRMQDEDGEWMVHHEQHRLADLSTLVSSLGDVGLEVFLELRIAQEKHIGAQTHTAGYRIVQEALTNVLRHSTAVTAQVRVGLEGNTVAIRVDDPGPPAHHGDHSVSGGRGLVGMRERAAEVGGELQVGPSGSHGWQVLARLPARQDDHAQPDSRPTGTETVTANDEDDMAESREDEPTTAPVLSVAREGSTGE